jgi:hypothetical protein
MTALTIQAFALLVASPTCNPMHWPIETLLGHAKIESSHDPAATHANHNGTTDYGLFQINSTNLERLGLTPFTALDPCLSMNAAEKVMLSTYNSGKPTASVPYALNVFAAVSKATSGASGAPTTPTLPPPPPTIHLHNQVASFTQ